MSAYRQFMMSAAPLRSTAMTLAPVDTTQLHDAMRALRQGKHTTAWWTSHRDAAFSRKVRVPPALLESVNITSAMSRTLAFSVRNFAPITRVSPDGVVFPEDREGFES